jgi:TRAP-type C4-dicarboxylate transport system permease small subunit
MLSTLIAATRAVAGLFFFGLLLCVFSGVVSRYLFNAPLTFTDEIAGYLFAGSALLGMTVTAFRGGHIRVDLFLARFGGAVRRRIEAAHWLISLVYVAILFVSGLDFFANALNKGLRAPTVLQTPVALVGVLLPISMALFLVERIAAIRRGRLSGPTDSEKGPGL